MCSSLITRSRRRAGIKLPALLSFAGAALRYARAGPLRYASREAWHLHFVVVPLVRTESGNLLGKGYRRRLSRSKTMQLVPYHASPNTRFRFFPKLTADPTSLRPCVPTPLRPYVLLLVAALLSVLCSRLAATITMGGHGDIQPNTVLTRVAAITQILSGVLLIVLALGIVLADETRPRQGAVEPGPRPEGADCKRSGE